MNSQSIWYLENIDVTGIFCPQKVGRGDMEQHVHKHYQKGNYIYLPEEHADKIYFLTEGRVKVGTYGDAEREITKAILGPGEVFGELSIIGEEKRRDFAYAMEDSVACVMSVQDMKNMMRNHSGLGLFLMKIMGSRMLEMEQRLESLIFKDSRTRIIAFVHELGLKKGQRVGYEVVVRKFITHQEIANFTATSRQTVTTVLNELRGANLIAFDRKRLLIRDMDRLAEMAAGEG
jgi:CRP/FNR family transcriptional regulator, cyclic AMP receptor protein